MEPAHIINRPGHEVGDKALTLCGVKWKINTLWADLPEDHPICRPCVDVAVRGMTDVTNLLAFASRRALLLLDTLSRETDLSQVIEDQMAYNDKQEAKAIAKAEKKAAKKEKKAGVIVEEDRPPIAPEENSTVVFQPGPEEDDSVKELANRLARSISEWVDEKK